MGNTIPAKLLQKLHCNTDCLWSRTSSRRKPCVPTCHQEQLPPCPEFLGCTVTGDKTWLHHFILTVKAALMEWKHTTSKTKKKFKTFKSAGKMMTAFWYVHGIPLPQFLDH
jgi:hypothetical protein